MDELRKHFDELASKIIEIGSPVSSGDINVMERIQIAQDFSWVIRTVVTAWNLQQSQERRLRTFYANAILVALLVEVLFAFAAFLLIGLEWIKVEQWVANVFFLSVFGQIAGGAIGIIRYLFPSGGIPLPMKLIEASLAGAKSKGDQK